MSQVLRAYERERFGRQSEVPDRAWQGYAEILARRETRIPQSLAGVRGLSPTPLRFGAPADVAPPTGMSQAIHDHLHRPTVDSLRTSLDAFRVIR